MCFGALDSACVYMTNMTILIVVLLLLMYMRYVTGFALVPTILLAGVVEVYRRVNYRRK